MNTASLVLACPTCANSFAEGGGNAAGLAILFLLCVMPTVKVGANNDVTQRKSEIEIDVGMR